MFEIAVLNTHVLQTGVTAVTRTAGYSNVAQDLIWMFLYSNLEI